VTEFLQRLNERDIDALTALMSEDHLLWTSLGNAIRGREIMRAGWRGYFAMCLDYRITCEHMLVVAVGSAGGTIVVSGDLLPENQWNIPAAWRAVGEGRLIPYKGVASLRR